MSIELRHISYTAGKRTILDNISLSVEDGEIVAILGPSGCGKTTLMKLVAQAIQPTCGTIEGNAHRIGFLRQGRTLQLWRTVRENVELGVQLQEHFTTGTQETIDSLLRSFDLEKSADLYPHEISGGMLRRAALAQTLALNPDLILLDEPFTGLDFATHFKIAEATRRYIRRTGATVLLVTHNPDEALLLADRMILLGGYPAQIIGQKAVRSDMELRDIHSFLKQMVPQHDMAA